MNFVEAGLTPIGFYQTNLIYAAAVFALTLFTEPGEFRAQLTQRQPLIWGLLCQHLALPVIVILATMTLYMPLGQSTGLVILSTMPALVLGSLLTWVADGKASLSILLVGFSTFISAVIAPSMLNLWAHWNPFVAHETALLRYTPIHTLIVAFGVIVLPALAGTLVRRQWPVVQRHAPKLIYLLVFISMCVPIGLIRNNADAIAASWLSTGLLTGLIYLASFAFTLKLCQSLALSAPISAAITLTVASQNAALAGLYLLTGLGTESDQILAGIWWVLFQYYGGLLLALHLRRRTRLAAKLSV